MTLQLCLVPKNVKGKCKGKKIESESRRKQKVKEDKDRIKNPTAYFYLTLQIHFIYL